MSPAVAQQSREELRRKTDRQLVLLARRELVRALELAGASAAAEAEARYSNAKMLLATAQVPEDENAELSAQLERVRVSLRRPGSACAACF